MKRTRRAPKPEWAAISTGYFLDPDIDALSDALKVAHIRLILFTVEQQTDGAIPTALPRYLQVTEKQVGALVKAGLVVTLGTARTLKGWGKWQKPRGEWEQDWENKVYAGRLAACQRWHADYCRCLEGEPPIKQAANG